MALEPRLAGLRYVRMVLLGGVERPFLRVMRWRARKRDRLLALRFTCRHTGEFQGTPATGNAVDITVMDYFRVADERLAEHWALMDNLSMLKQIGAVNP